MHPTPVDGCPSDDLLLDLLAGRLTGDAREGMEQHLDGCGDCRSVLADAARGADETVPEAPPAGRPGALPKALADAPTGARTDAAGAGPRGGARPGLFTLTTPGLPAGALAKGAALGRYLILRNIGEGGMGVVYSAYDPRLDRKVAIKLLRIFGNDPEQAAALRGRLLREAQAMARLTHPNVIAVHDVGTFDGQVFIAMELVDGGTLRDWFEKEIRPWREIVALFRAAGQGLAAAHRVGIVHRDFKPDNVLLGKDGRVRVTDFGLARLWSAKGANDSKGAEGSRATEGAALRDLLPLPAGTLSPNALATPLTKVGTMVGSPAYMAPEQMEGEAVGPQADQFSFCVSLYEALYGRRPFSGRTVGDLRDRIVEGKCREPKEGRAAPSAIRRAVLRGLRPGPSQRHASMDKLCRALARDPSRAWVRPAAIASALALLSLAAVARVQTTRSTALLCTGAARKLAQIWDEPLKAQVRAAFGATHAPYADASFQGAARALDRYAQGWAAMHVEACEATRLRHEQPEDVLDLRMQCLDDRRREMGALVSVLATADAKVVARASRAAAALEPLGLCKDVPALRSGRAVERDPKRRAEIEAVQQELAQARALAVGTRYQEGLARAEAALLRARAMHDRGLEGEALAAAGLAHSMAGETKASLRDWEEAAGAALASGNDRLQAGIWAELCLQFGVDQSRFEEGERWAAWADAAAERMGGSDDVQVHRLKCLGAMAAGRGAYEKGLVHFGRALELTGHLLPEAPLQEAQIRDQIANLLSAQGKSAEALEQLRRALQLYEREVGPRHPIVAEALNTQAGVLIDEGQYEEALALLRRALVIDEEALGKDNSGSVFVLVQTGDVLLDLGRAGEALDFHQRALRIVDTAEGSRVELGFALGGVGQDLIALGRAREALVPLERAVELLERIEADPGDVAEANGALAHALFETGGDPARARALATRARDTFAGLESHYGGKRYARERSKIDAWFAAAAPR